MTTPMITFARRCSTIGWSLCVGALLVGCSASDLVDVGQSDAGQTDDGIVHSYPGALGLYRGAIGRMETAVSFYVLNTGIFTDELNATTVLSKIDARSGVDTSELSATSFTQLSATRNQAQQAIGALSQYSQARPANIGEMYALQGMTEVLMAETFCSGIPLSDAPFGQDFKYSAAMSTQAVLAQAVAHFDTALTYAGDSAAVLTLARVGKGRALLDAGDYPAAMAAVASVPTSGQYVLQYGGTIGNQVVYESYVSGNYTVRSGEGQNGIQWLTTPMDPRVPLQQPLPVSPQAKYLTNTASIVLADGVEARLIEAEAQLKAQDYTAWIGTLDALAATKAGVVAPIDPGSVNGSDSARVSRQFEERARWLFLTGHRAGDLRRLVRQYDRPATTVYPSGVYSPTLTSLGAFLVYGNDIVVAPPSSERANNPLYKGCIDRHA